MRVTFIYFKGDGCCFQNPKIFAKHRKAFYCRQHGHLRWHFGQPRDSNIICYCNSGLLRVWMKSSEYLEMKEFYQLLKEV